MTTKEAITTLDNVNFQIANVIPEEGGGTHIYVKTSDLNSALSEAINALKAVEQLEAYCAEWESNLTPSDSEELFEIVDSIKSILKEEE